ncbi:nucleoside hydrolase [Ligilactobacillus saerimneri]|uniref:nucleoside hydrolase n=1 Tax=Ligilactobacillus saerimneri TaxID=228229 RepID=UPI001DDAFB48|nr:nucleoside hydrolase [Ligilactobacillus saerimneri]MCZ0891816.1 nucleoside hydrolase [Ligilactobacillus saerimneri]HJF29266.1 nucleoside hydrolase [Ligilactobacillus saerimneri]
MTKYKVILDLDTGIDDAMALAYSLTLPNCDLIGVLSSYGNVVSDLSANNSLKLLDLLHHPEVPVYKGAEHALNQPNFTVLPVSAHIHGTNGVGEVTLPETDRTVATTSAVDFIIAAAHQYQDRLIVIPTGPLTNLAQAFQKDPQISHLIGKVVFMGGALTVPGNVSPAAEANIAQDPEAANIVLRGGFNITMVGLDVTLRTVLTKKETAHWRSLGTTAGQLYADIVDYYIDVYGETSPHLHGCALHDPLAVGIAADPSLAQTIALDMKVDLTDAFRGRTIGNEERLKEPTTTAVCVNVDVDRFTTTFMAHMNELLQESGE